MPVLLDGPEPHLTRAEVAKILNCTPLTIRNRERSGKYPPARRHPINNYRIYSIEDILWLQMNTYDQIFIGPVVSILHDKGYTDMTALNAYVSAAVGVIREEAIRRVKAQKIDE
jgi:hypothetical protein